MICKKGIATLQLTNIFQAQLDSFITTTSKRLRRINQSWNLNYSLAFICGQNTEKNH